MNRIANTILLFTFFFLFTFPGKISAQLPAQILDSIKLSLHQKPSLNFGIDSRNSFIGNGLADILGAKLGVVFGNKFGIGLSGHLLNVDDSHFYKDYSVPASGNSAEMVQAHLQLFYMAVYAEYIFHKSKYWKFSVPLQLGWGESNYLYTLNNQEKINNRHSILLCEPIFASEYKINTWLSLTGEIGIRLMLLNNPAVMDNFNSPTFSIGLSVTYTQFCKQFFPDSQLSRWLDKI